MTDEAQVQTKEPKIIIEKYMAGKRESAEPEEAEITIEAQDDDETERKSIAGHPLPTKKEVMSEGSFALCITALYLVLGAFLNMWHPAWLLFLTIPIHAREFKRPIDRLFDPVTITLLYLILGFYFHFWHPGWLIFLLIPLKDVILGKLKPRKADSEDDDK
ncbi:MAG: hypothetical protein PHI27_08850 [Eubacteriales bacterium]|nr:hypothetical protein [Eubacteriales bacterium]MDD3882348.1 hypothetical protein [Eubacteriales bacterium]MDD4512431.1 hypothetical protein [Eubacteriales bacterium]